MATWFRAGSDIVIANGYPGFYMDPSGDDNGLVDKVGFDLTAPYGIPDTIETRWLRARASTGNGAARVQARR